MAFWGDYHTHSVFSHGKGSVEENVLAARAAGLKAIAITDHGVCGFPKNLQPADIPVLKAEIERCRAAYPDMTVLAGVESNLISDKGDIDMPEGAEEMFDLIICGYHAVRIPDSPRQFFKLWVPNSLPTKNTARRRARNTDALIRAMRDHRVGVIAHPMRQFPCDLKALGEAAKEYGVYLELNSKSCALTTDELEIIVSTGCGLVCSSDAHSPDRVGDFSAAGLVDAAGLDRSVIAYWEAFPKFR